MGGSLLQVAAVVADAVALKPPALETSWTRATSAWSMSRRTAGYVSGCSKEKSKPASARTASAKRVAAGASVSCDRGKNGLEGTGQEPFPAYHGTHGFVVPARCHDSQIGMLWPISTQGWALVRSISRWR